ncbi:hypothetical protein PVL30_004267 [Lodderomyces elongisporus]|uniref:uncharacterized protein n=1 Tax=Lodderomyces elongisporus TaxID=36914 RepID=UPI0029258444|nr:uncharacterized protein PVL30_004267 [Lodderomyces elongisporus]WLF80485.1 hypothetical protein PVL30_004267 [Lodderomyces elongisporus]
MPEESPQHRNAGVSPYSMPGRLFKLFGVKEHHHHIASAHLPLRLLALFVSIFVALASGTPYLYGVYSPQLIKRIGLTTSDSATISLASNMGSSIGGLPGGLLIDHYGPQLSIFIGSICIFLGYFVLFKIYQHQYAHLLVICVAMIFVGFGSITSYFATLKASQANFPKNKGVAGAIPVSCYGFAATVFSIISAAFFNDNAGELLEFLACFCGAVNFFGSFFVHVYHADEEDGGGDIEDQEIFNPSSSQSQYSRDRHGSNYLPEDEISLLTEIEPPAQSVSKAESLKGSFSFWGIGDRTPRASMSLQESEANSIVGDLRGGNATNGNNNSDNNKNTNNTNAITNSGNAEEVTVAKVKARLQTPYQTIKERLTDKVFLTHYLIVSVASGIGQMYIYSVGFVVIAQYYYNKKHGIDMSSRNVASTLAHDPEAASIQAIQVSIISIASFVGRLLSGFISDYIYKQWHIQRLWIVAFTLILLASGQFIAIQNVSSFHLTSVVSAIIGGSYGLIFGTYPAVIADSFGTKTFSTNWGLICTGPLLILFVLNKYFGWIYDLNTDKETGICYLGNKCYMGAFEASLVLCGVCFVVVVALMFTQRKRN